MDLYTTLLDILERHPEIESVQDIPREERRAILLAMRNEADDDLLVAIFRGQDWLADDRENMLYEQVALASWRAVNQNPEDIEERDRLIAEWLWHVSRDQIEEALQDVRAEEAA